MTVTIPLVVIAGVAAFVCYRWVGLKLWHLVVCALLGFLLAGTSLAPDIQNFLHAILNGGRK